MFVRQGSPQYDGSHQQGKQDLKDFVYFNTLLPLARRLPAPIPARKAYKPEDRAYNSEMPMPRRDESDEVQPAFPA